MFDFHCLSLSALRRFSVTFGSLCSSYSVLLAFIASVGLFLYLGAGVIIKCAGLIGISITTIVYFFYFEFAFGYNVGFWSILLFLFLSNFSPSGIADNFPWLSLQGIKKRNLVFGE